MVGYLANTHHVTFSDRDFFSQDSNHNNPLHLGVYINKNKTRWVLVDCGAGLNIFTMEMVTTLGLSEACMGSSKINIIKAYDDAERSSKGSISLPIRVGAAILDTTF